MNERRSQRSSRPIHFSRNTATLSCTDKEPPTGTPGKKAYLDLLRSCHIYLLLIDVEYGKPSGDVSATHEEYRLAQELKIPTLVFIKGADSKKDAARENKTKEFIEETKRDGYK